MSNAELSDTSDEEQWDEQEDILTDDSEPEESEIKWFGISQRAEVLAKWLTLYLLQLQTRYGLSDKAISSLFSFLTTFLCILGTFNALCNEIAKAFPRSLYLARSTLTERVKFCRYVVCRKCHKQYFVRDCIDGSGTRQKSKVCSFVRFPSHKQLRMRQQCNTPLLKSVECVSGRQILYPFLTYCNLSLTVSLQGLFKQAGFASLCEQWRHRTTSIEQYNDLYDGKVWKEFQVYNGKNFLRDPFNLAIMMNMDFFQPYKHVNYSVGAIYCTIMNLPRSVRYKQENVLLLGLIPGPHEPENDINSYMEPIVTELLELWPGVEFTFAGGDKHKVRCALLCVACDIPGGRKTCGFLSHSANYGCSKCLKLFPGGVGSKDYSGFDRENWRLRTMVHHRRTALDLEKCNNKTELRQKESSTGCRYSVLLKLPYFDPPRFLIVDPMHNLYLGSAKHYLKRIWLDKNIVSDKDFEIIQQRADSIVTPAGIGRVPHKIRSGFASFTADQWKNWVNYYSLLAMGDIFLQGNDLECWRHFVLASRILCSHQLSSTELQLGDILLLSFCKRTEFLYGKEVITPNMHMHAHLRTCIEDYGPMHGFWLYAFERYNGVLGSIPNNNRTIEVQLMNRFTSDNNMLCTSLPCEFRDCFEQHFTQRKLVGSVAETVNPQTLQLSSEWTLGSNVVLPPNRSRCMLDDIQLSHLPKLLCKLYSVSSSSIDIPSFCWKYRTIELNGKQLGSYRSRSVASSCVLVLWKRDVLGAPIASGITLPVDPLRAARINFFLLHKASINGTPHEHLLASLSWFLYHPKFDSKGKPITVWCHDLFEPTGLHSLIPVNFIKNRAVSLVCSRSGLVPGESVLLVCPCID